jgi:uncharacterized membrane protein YraQ (UPF0718 family)
MISILTNTLFESAPYVILGFLIAGILRFWVPQDILQRHLGGRSPGTLFKSVGIGCVLPLCSCGTIPLGIGLFKNGASIGNMLAFMTSTPVLSPVLIALSLTMLGLKLTATLLLAATAGALLLGTAANHLFGIVENPKETDSETPQFTPVPSRKGIAERNKLLRTLKWSFGNLGADVSVDIIIGLAIASLLQAYLPLEWISRWLGQQDLLTLIYVVLLGIPVYACSIPSIAVVQGLLLLGATPGAAVAYMIAGPATNLGELNAIRNSMGGKPMAFYAASLIIIALVAGFITDQLVFPDYQYHAYRTRGELVVNQCCVPVIFGEGIGNTISTREIPVWNQPFGIMLFAVIFIGITKKVLHFFVNPCRACSWRAFGTSGFCGSRCHVRRKYELLRNFGRKLFGNDFKFPLVRKNI